MKRILLSAAAMLLWSGQGFAEPKSEDEAGKAAAHLDPMPPPEVHVVDELTPTTPVVPRKNDLLGSHLLIGAASGPLWSLGHLGSDLAAGQALGTGLNARIDAGYGVSRSVALGVLGSFTTYTDGDACRSCASKSFAVGPFVRYQLSQGLRFDPWFLLGGSYRRVSFTDDGNVSRRFSGLEWLHLELGADYYVFSGLGVGPYAALGLSSFSARPSGSGSAAVNTELSVGLRLLLDVPGR